MRASAVSRAGRMPASRSRAAASRTVVTARTAISATRGTSAHGCEPVRGWSLSIQPSGVTQCIQLRPDTAAATIRSTKQTPNAARGETRGPAAGGRELARERADDEEQRGRRDQRDPARNSELLVEKARLSWLRPSMTVMPAVTTNMATSAMPSPARACAAARPARVVTPVSRSSPPPGLFLTAVGSVCPRATPRSRRSASRGRRACHVVQPATVSMRRVAPEEGFGARVAGDRGAQPEPVGRGRVRGDEAGDGRHHDRPEHEAPQNALPRRVRRP